MYSERSRRSKRAKGYIVEQKIRIEDLDSDKWSKNQFEVRFKTNIEEVLNLRLEAKVEKQAIDK